MPFIRYKGFDKDFLLSFAPQLAKQFAEITGVPTELIKMELLPTEPLSAVPQSVEILMFPRHQAVHDAIAKCFNDCLRASGHPGVHIFFILLSPALYYKEGKPLLDYHYSEAGGQLL